MRSLRARVLFALALLALAAVASPLVLYPSRMERGAPRAARLPLTLAGWSGQELPIEDYVKQLLETDDVIQRRYLSTRPGEPAVDLAVVFSPDNRRVAHPPEVCYRGSGWEVSDKRILRPADAPPMVRLIMDAGAGRRDMVLYCYKAGPRVTAGYWRQQLNIAVNQLLLRATSSALIRFSTPITTTEADAQARLLAFIRPMIPEVQRTLK